MAVLRRYEVAMVGISILFAYGALAHAATTPPSGGGGGTGVECPKADPAKNEEYNSTKAPGKRNEARNGAIVTITNLYGAKKTKALDKGGRVTCQCTAEGNKCKGLTWTDPSGKEHVWDEKDKSGDGSTPKQQARETTPKQQGSATTPKTQTSDTTPKRDDAGSSALKDALDPNSSSAIKRNLHEGMRGDDVKALQRIVGAREDGIFGPETKAKVTEWQQKHPELQDTISREGGAGNFGPRSRAVLRAEQQAAGPTENTFAGEKSPTAQRRSASTFSAPESAPASSRSQGANRGKASFYDTPGCGAYGLGSGGSCAGSRDRLRPGDVAVPVGSGYKPNQIINATFCGPAGCRTYPLRVHDTCAGCARKGVSIDVWGPAMRRQIEGNTGYNFSTHGFIPVIFGFR